MSLKEIQTRIATLDTLNADIQSSLDMIETGQCADVKAEITRLSPQVKKYFENLESVKIVYRDLSDIDRRGYSKTFKAYRKQYIGILSRIKDASTRSDRNELFHKSTQNAQEDDDSTEDKYIKQGEDLLSSNKQILVDTINRVHEARQIGESDVDTLRAQNEQLQNMNDNLKQMDTSLDVSKRLIRSIARRVMFDKVLWILIILIIAAVIVLVITSRMMSSE